MRNDPSKVLKLRTTSGALHGKSDAPFVFAGDPLHEFEPGDRLLDVAGVDEVVLLQKRHVLDRHRLIDEAEEAAVRRERIRVDQRCGLHGFFSGSLERLEDARIDVESKTSVDDRLLLDLDFFSRPKRLSRSEISTTVKQPRQLVAGRQPGTPASRPSEDRTSPRPQCEDAIRRSAKGGRVSLDRPSLRRLWTRSQRAR